MAKLRSGELPELEGTSSKSSGLPYIPFEPVPKSDSGKPKPPPGPPPLHFMRPPAVETVHLADEDHAAPAAHSNYVDGDVSMDALDGAAAAFVLMDLGFLYIHVHGCSITNSFGGVAILFVTHLLERSCCCCSCVFFSRNAPLP